MDVMEDKMTLPMRDRQASFFDVSFLAEGLFGPADPYGLFRQEILPALEAACRQLSVSPLTDEGAHARLSRP